MTYGDEKFIYAEVRVYNFEHNEFDLLYIQA